jgi:hypothetical protein
MHPAEFDYLSHDSHPKQCSATMTKINPADSQEILILCKKKREDFARKTLQIGRIAS